MNWPIVPGAEPFAHVAEHAGVGALVIHGFTGTPVSMLPIGRALAAAGHHVELPRLPGHATHIDDMVATVWGDWYAEVAHAYDHLCQRADRVVVVGQSMGATLALTLAVDRPVIGVVAINPLTRDRGADAYEMIDELLADRHTVVPGGPSDIACGEAFDPSYTDTPLAALRSLLHDGAGELTDRLASGTAPLRLFTSRQDHVVDPADSEFLAGAWGGTVEHTWLERSYHVATLDYDGELVTAGTAEFVARLAA